MGLRGGDGVGEQHVIGELKKRVGAKGLGVVGVAEVGGDDMGQPGADWRGVIGNELGDDGFDG